MAPSLNPSLSPSYSPSHSVGQAGLAGWPCSLADGWSRWPCSLARWQPHWRADLADWLGWLAWLVAWLACMAGRPGCLADLVGWPGCWGLPGLGWPGQAGLAAGGLAHYAVLTLLYFTYLLYCTYLWGRAQHSKNTWQTRRAGFRNLDQKPPCKATSKTPKSRGVAILKS